MATANSSLLGEGCKSPCATRAPVQPAAVAVLRSIRELRPLAQRREFLRYAVGWVVVELGCSQDDPSGASLSRRGGLPCYPALTVTLRDTRSNSRYGHGSRGTPRKADDLLAKLRAIAGIARPISSALCATPSASHADLGFANPDRPLNPACEKGGGGPSRVSRPYCGCARHLKVEERNGMGQFQVRAK